MVDKIIINGDLFETATKLWNKDDTFKRVGNVWKAYTTGGNDIPYDVTASDVREVIEDSVNAGEEVFATLNRKRWQVVPTDYQKRYTLRAFMDSSQFGWQIYTDNGIIFSKKRKNWERQDPATGETTVWTQKEVDRFVRFTMKLRHSATGYDGEEPCVLS